MQFCPDAVFRKCVIELEIAKGKFIAKARFLAEAGWRTLLGNKERDEENDGTPLPVVAKDDELLCERGSGRAPDAATTPFHRCDAALRHDRDCPFCTGQRAEKILRATDGLGTEATRAGIIELLFKRGFWRKRALYSLHRAGQGINPLPAGAGRPAGYDGALGIGADANQRETVPLSGLYAAAGGDAVPADRSGAQHAGEAVQRNGGTGWWCEETV